MPHPNVLRVIDRIFRTGIAYLCMAVLIDSACSTCQAEQPTLEEAMRALESWRASFNSIHITYEIDEGVIETSSTNSAITIGEYYWSEAKRFYWYDRFIEDGKQLCQYLDWGDGHISGRAFYPTGEGQEQARPTMIFYGRIDPGGDNGALGRAVTSLYGLWQAPTCRWLPEILREKQVTARVVSADSTQCLEVAYQDADNKPPITLVLDPRYSYLPRSMLTGWHYRVSEFKRFEPGIWMPTVGVLDLRERKQVWEITSVVFNQDIADEKVRIPEPGQGTRITDTSQGKSWYHGTPPAVPKAVDENDPSHVQGTGGTIVAKPHTEIWNSLPLWLTLIGITTLIISGLIRMKHKI